MPAKHSNTIIMIEGALTIALAVVLSRFDLFRMPQGGTIDFELVPLIILTYRRGFKWGLITGALFGVLRALIGGYILNFFQFVLDYPAAFACVSLVAFSPKFVGLIFAMAGQTLFSVLSGVIFFAEYAPEGQNVWAYSFFYNAPVLGVKYLISFIMALILWKALERELPVR